MNYLNQKFTWSRTNYLNFYGQALGSSDCFHKLEYASGKIEMALDALFNYTDAKTNNPDPDRIDAARKAFLAQCATNNCVDALRFATQSLNGGDLNSANQGFGCDLSEALAKGAPQVQFYRGHRDLALMMHAGAFNYVMMGVLVQSAYITLSQSNTSAWEGVQDIYENNLFQGYDRFFRLDQVITNSEM